MPFDVSVSLSIASAVIFLLSNQLTPSLFNIARACGGLECKIGKFVHIYDDAEEALTSFSMKGQPLPQRYFEKMKHNQMKKIVTFYPLLANINYMSWSLISFLREYLQYNNCV